MSCIDDHSQITGDWIASVAKLPVAFAQVREDPLIDHEIIRSLQRPARVLMVASGGDTACFLTSLPLDDLHLVDINAAQLNLTHYKLHLMGCEPPQRRLELLGHLPMMHCDRMEAMKVFFNNHGLSDDAFGPFELVARLGVDHCGRYECMFAMMRTLLDPHRSEIVRLMGMTDLAEQARMMEDGSPVFEAIKDAFLKIMDLPLLVQVFGSGATANRVQPFADHFFQQTCQVLRSQPASLNPFLHQIFLGSFVQSLWPWHTAERATAPSKIRYSHGAMSEVLQNTPRESVDFVGLSNILDWVDPGDASRILSDAWRSLSSDGIVVIRQLNSRLDIRKLPSGFQWLEEESNRYQERDRSFFYRQLHVGLKK